MPSKVADPTGLDVMNPGNDGWNKQGEPIKVDDNGQEIESHHGPKLGEAIENQLIEQGFVKENDSGSLLNYWAASMPWLRNNPGNSNYMWAADALMIEFERLLSLGVDISRMSLEDLDELYRSVYNERTGMAISIAVEGTLIAPLAQNTQKLIAISTSTEAPPKVYGVEALPDGSLKGQRWKFIITRLMRLIAEMDDD